MECFLLQKNDLASEYSGSNADIFPEVNYPTTSMAVRHEYIRGCQGNRRKC